MPAYHTAIELFIADGYDKGLKSGTVRAGVAAISFYHKMNGLTDPTRHYRVTRTLMGMGKSCRVSKKLLPISFNLLMKIVDQT